MTPKELLMLIILIFVTSTLSFVIAKKMYNVPVTINTYNGEITTKPVPSPIENISEKPNKIEKTSYPTGTIFSLGKAWIDADAWNSSGYPHDSFILNIDPSPFNIKDKPLTSYEIPIIGDITMDGISNPLISYNEKFGCVLLQSSGYIGYYVFSIPDGKKIGQGEQYSECLEWINDHEVIIAEHLYGESNYDYYILDANTGNKKQISSMSSKGL
jgi:hypothetical protein